MKFGQSALLAVLVLATSSCDAFSIRSKSTTAVQKAILTAQHQEKGISLAKSSPMSMVAGGAERAYGDDYYDGK